MLDAGKGVAEPIERSRGLYPEYELYSFRRRSTGAMPDAYTKIEASGVYVCINIGPREILDDIQVAFAAVGLYAEPEEL